MERINVAGIALEVKRIAGPAMKAPIVFLHEGLGSVAVWGGWPERVCAQTGRAGVVYSRCGYGHSDPMLGGGNLQADYLHHEGRSTLPALLSELKIEEPVLLGHSDGGSIALLYASQFPTTACIVMAPHVLVEQVSLDAIAKVRKAFTGGGLRKRLSRYHADVDNAFWQWSNVWLSDAFRSFDIRPDCRRIEAPVLAIQGVDDPYGTMRQIEEIAPTRGSVELCRILQCGHSPHREQHDATLAALTSFLSRQPI